MYIVMVTGELDSKYGFVIEYIIESDILGLVAMILASHQHHHLHLHS
jgi:hypothetical protein